MSQQDSSAIRSSYGVRRLGLIAIVTAAAALLVPIARAQFAPGPNPIPNGTTTGAQALSAGTGTVNSGGKISTSGATLALSMTGTSTLVNNGTIEQTGSARAIDSNSGTANLTATNNGLISSVSTDAFRVGTNSAISLTNSGTIQVTTGGQALDWANITSASNSLTNQSTGSITSVDSDAIRPGANGIINNSGLIKATLVVPPGGTAGGSDGIQADLSGVQVTNNGTGTIEGRTGVTGGPTVVGTPYTISVTNNTGGVISGTNGSGVNIDGVNTNVTATIINQSGATMKGTWDGISVNGDGDGIDVDGVLNLTNRGFIRGLGANGNGNDMKANGPDGVAAGGGTIVNEAGAEITSSITSGDATSGFGILIDDSSKGNSIAATNLTNRGKIQSDNGPAVVFISTFGNSITNDTGGLISGAGLAGVDAAIQSGNGNDTIVNRGTITAVSNDLAIDMQGGNNSLTIEGGAATINGRINGGAGGTNSLTVSPGAGNTFSYAGKLSNFNTVQINAGTTSFSGDNSYTGTTTISGGTLLAKNGGGSATGTGLVTIQSGGTLGGPGIVSNVSVQSGGNITPREGATTASLRTGAVTFTSGAVFNVQLNGTTAGAQYDQIVATGNVTLGNATLNVGLGFAPGAGTSFTIVQTSGSVSGTFLGLTDGAQITAGGKTFVIHYTATTVTLTVTTPGPTPTATATATATATPVATPTATATSTPGSTPTATPTATPGASAGTVGNVSTRLPVGTGENILIEGFIVQGPAGSLKKIIIRAIGPSLVPFGILDAVANPILEIHDSSTATVATNDNWKSTIIGGLITSDQTNEINNSGVAPSNDAESAIIAELAPGSYTAQVRGVGNTTGTGVVDAYDLSSASPARLVNIATRGLIQPGDKLMIAGFIVQSGPVTVVLRATGPSLTAFGINNALPDTTLQLRNQNGVIVRENDDWMTDQKAALEATGLQPSNDREAALIETIPPGQYTAQVRGKPEATGIGVVEVYFLQ